MPEHVGEILKKKGFTVIHNVFDNERVVLFKCVTMLGDEVFVKFDNDDNCEANKHDEDVHFHSHESEIIHQEVKRTHIDMVGDDAYGVVFECELGMCQARKCVDQTTESTTWIRNTTKKAMSKTNEFIVETKEKCPRKFPVVLYSEIKARPMEVAMKVRKLTTKFACTKVRDYFCGMKNMDHYLVEIQRKWCDVKSKIDSQVSMTIDSIENIDRDLMVLYCMVWKCKLANASSCCQCRDCCVFMEKIHKLRKLRAYMQQFVDKCMCWIRNVTSNAECLKQICCDISTEYPTLCEHFNNMFDSVCKCTGTTSSVSFNPSVTVVNERRFNLMIERGASARQMLGEGVTVHQLKSKGYVQKDWQMDKKVLAMKIQRGVSPAVLLAEGATLEQLNENKIAAYNEGQILDTFEDDEMVDRFRQTYRGEDYMSMRESATPSIVTAEDADMSGSVVNQSVANGTMR